VRASFGDYAWFTGQACLFLGMLAAPFIQRRHMPWTLRGAGLVLIAAGGAVAAAGYTTLGESHSAWSSPDAEANLVTTGIYRSVRHPIYLGWCLAASGIALLTGSSVALTITGLTAAFYTARPSYEERLLSARYPDYAEYVCSSSRFVPARTEPT